MAAVTVPNRPFSTHPATGLMMPDGIFEASVGLQEINAQFRNDSGATLAPGTVVYLESVSHPSIVVVPQTMPAAGLPPAPPASSPGTRTSPPPRPVPT